MPTASTDSIFDITDITSESWTENSTDDLYETSTELADGIALPINVLDSDTNSRWILAQTIIVTILAASGFVLNNLVILCIVLSKKLQVTSSYFIGNLNVSGVILCALSYPLYMLDINTSHQHLIEGSFGAFWCNVRALTSRVCILQILISIALVSYNRYVLMAKPKDIYDRRYSNLRSFLYVLSSWVLAAAVVGFPMLSPAINLTYIKRLGYCDFPESSRVVAYMGLALFLTCLGLVARCYVKVYRHLRAEMSDKTEIPTSQQIKSKRVRYKATKNMLILTTAYCSCCFPYFILQVVATDYVVSPVAHHVVNLMLFATPVLNPILYACRNKIYWIAMKAVVTCIMPDRQLRESLKRIEERKRQELERRSRMHSQRISQSHDTGLVSDGGFQTMDSVLQNNHTLDAVKEELALSVTQLEKPDLKPRSAPVTSTCLLNISITMIKGGLSNVQNWLYFPSLQAYSIEGYF